MLEHTFLHFAGIGRTRERQFWAEGIRSWSDLERALSPGPNLFPETASHPLVAEIARSREALSRGDMDFFAERLPKSEHYRIAMQVPQQTLFLDIETTGLSTYYDEITLVGGSVDGKFHCYLAGVEDDKIRSLIERSSCLVTFNGLMFDLKFLLSRFPDLKVPKAHVDLRFLAARLGHRGGQKAIEEKFNFERTLPLKGMGGELAPVLWHEYQLGNRDSAKRLVTYNQFDVLGMRSIFDRLLQQLIPLEKPPINPETIYRFSEKPKTLAWTKNRRGSAPHKVYLPSKIGGGKPRISFKELAKELGPAKTRFVGIDLTGSESRPTGWCLLDGDHAQTKLLNTDEEILIESMVVKPDVVSIDSPLSLPEGRKSVRDDDPGRKEFGIMRQCERELKRRGVNVYPALIPSMQNLTARGMRLAAQFRALGIPVIESYPGAAQDIMGLPRKRASLEQLKRGMGAFGVKGDCLNTKVSHDEVDAVTAAIVGLFFWSGRFEALGNEIEDYLIIPDLTTSPERWLSRNIVGISGPIAVGKTTAAAYVSSKGFDSVRFSQVLEELLRERKKKPTRANLQAIGEEINKSPGQRWFAKKVAAFHKNSDAIVIDGLRHPEDRASLIEYFGPCFRHVHLDAPETVRRQRYEEMGRRPREFDKAIFHPVESKVPYLSMLASEVIENIDSVDRLYRSLDRFISVDDRYISVVGTEEGGAVCP